ncbi:MAG: hypothetical protein EZS28_005496 [Streblomastix strix]|uniref:Oxidation resistance protein 1 n=1 Tax=Streblomastix strix TaxID=222440 RepID=A0A5J4WVW8_9EUKA|nr:MAG: hypothetical protein EZS28_005496 [Streblomastix strix]
MPNQFRRRLWKLIYSKYEHGTSLQTIVKLMREDVEDAKEDNSYTRKRSQSHLQQLQYSNIQPPTRLNSNQQSPLIIQSNTNNIESFVSPASFRQGSNTQKQEENKINSAYIKQKERSQSQADINESRIYLTPENERDKLQGKVLDWERERMNRKFNNMAAASGKEWETPIESPFVLVMKDGQGNIFGAFLSHTLTFYHRYYGSSETFVFGFAEKKEFILNKQDKEEGRQNMVKEDEKDKYEDKIQIHHPNPAIRLSSSLSQGSSSECHTFESPCLLNLKEISIQKDQNSVQKDQKNKDFTAGPIEIWSLAREK